MPSALAFINGRILTMDPSTPTADAVVIEGGRIAAVGERAMLRSFPGCEVEDLAGRTLCPGFIDAHHHLSIAALHPRWADLSGSSTLEELTTELSEQARKEPEQGWVRGAGWSEIGKGVTPHRRDLDALGLDRPVIAAHYSLHQAVVDSRGLDQLGIGRDMEDPEGGMIGRDPDGEPNGLLVERAWSRAHADSLAPYSDPSRWADHIEVLARSLLADGITAVHDAACAPAAESAYRQLDASGRLPISIVVMPHPAAILDPLDKGRLSGRPTGDGGEMLRVGAVKLFADGGVAPAIDARVRGAAMRFGTLFAGLAEQVELAVSRGFRVAVHALGNEGLATALDAFANAVRRFPAADHRFRVEHACLASPPQLRDLHALGGVAVVQPGFVHHLGQAVEGVAFDNATWLPFADIVDAGVPIAASSDSPCTFHAPVLTSARGASRRTGSGNVLDPGQAVPYDEWLRAYTAGAAHAGGQESERGMLRPGLRADLVVLDGPLDMEAPPAVAQTWVGGRLVHSSDGAVNGAASGGAPDPAADRWDQA